MIARLARGNDGVTRTYTPTWTTTGTAPGLGSGSITGRYLRQGPLCWFSILLVFNAGNTTPGTGDFRFSLPFDCLNAVEPIVIAKATIPGGTYAGVARLVTGSGVFSIHGHTSATVAWGSTQPGTWTGGASTLSIAGWYEVAAGT